MTNVKKILITAAIVFEWRNENYPEFRRLEEADLYADGVKTGFTLRRENNRLVVRDDGRYAGDYTTVAPAKQVAQALHQHKIYQTL